MPPVSEAPRARGQRARPERAPRVLVLTPGFITAATGAQVPGVVDLFLALQGRIDLEIHLISADSARRGPITREGVELWPHGESRGGRLGRWLLALGRRPRYDVVWALWLRESAVWARAARRILGVPVVASVIGGEVSDLPGIGYGEGGSARGRRLVDGLLARSRLITVGSPILRDDLARRSPDLADRIRVAPLGVPDLPFRTDPPWDGARPLRLVSVTRIEPVKGPGRLLDAVAELRRRGHDVHLDLYGYTEANARPWLESQSRSLGLEGRVHHRGLVRPEVLRAAYPSYSVLIHSSLHESQGMALIEAAVARLPIATTRVGVVDELVSMGAALEVAGATAASLADAVERAGKRTDEARAAVLSRYGLGPCAERFASILEEASASG